MFTCELCGKPIEAGICELCISELGLELYQEKVEISQDNFFAEWCVETEDSEDSGVEEEMVQSITRGVLDTILAGRSVEEYAFDSRKGPLVDDVIYPLTVGSVESCPCRVCGRWSTGLCCN